MRHVYLSVARHTGQEISQVSVAESANTAGYRTNQPTVGKYLHYLADALLIREFRRYPLTRRASTRVPAKICLSDLGVRNAILRGAPSLGESSPDVVGPLVETLVQSCIRDSNLQVHYYREYENPANRNSPVREVDFIAEETDGTVLPIEVKFRKTVDSKDTLGLRHFISKYRPALGILITRDTLGWDPHGPILSIPLLDFLVRFQ
jgi:predicted AAA+ superfamily ATPase